MVIADDHSNLRHRDVVILLRSMTVMVLAYGLQTAGLITWETKRSGRIDLA